MIKVMKNTLNLLTSINFIFTRQMQVVSKLQL